MSDGRYHTALIPQSPQDALRSAAERIRQWGLVQTPLLEALWTVSRSSQVYFAAVAALAEHLGITGDAAVGAWGQRHNDAEVIAALESAADKSTP